MKRYIPLIGILMFTVVHSVAQKTTVTGRVTEKSNGDPIPYANVIFRNSTVGAITDTNGIYKMSTTGNYDSLVISVLGYKRAAFPVKKGQEQTIDAALTSTMFDLSEVVINPGENPAWPILRKVIKNKDKNSPEAKSSYSFEEYTKIQFDLNHFTEKIKNNIILRPFDFLWDHVDSTEDGVAYLPILLIENISEHYYVKEGNHKKESITARKTTGLKGPKIMEFVEDMHLHANLYNNYVELLGKNFPSPLNDNYKTNYRFYLTDSIKEEGELFYEIAFKPRSFNAQAFSGHMLIHKGSYALKEIVLRFDITANVNFVRSYWIKQEFERYQGEHWMLSASRLLGDFTVLENQSEMTGFYGRKSTSIRNMKVNQPVSDSVFKGVDQRIEVEGATDRSEEYWQNVRHDTLSGEERDIYTMVDRVEAHPAYKLRKNLVRALWFGYYPKKYIDLGHLYTFYCFNQVEYSRFKLGFRTNDDLFKNTVLSGFAAYGVKDDKFKYGGTVDHIFQEKGNRFFRVGGMYRYDIEQLGWSYSFVPIDHLFASGIQLNHSKTRMYFERSEAYIERQWFTGFNTRITAFMSEVSPSPGLSFDVKDGPDTSSVASFRRGGARLGVRYAPGIKESSADYYGQTHDWEFAGFPIVSLQYGLGIKGILASEFDFHELKLRLDYRFKFRKWGYTNYLIEGGKIWGTLPYHFLQIPFGNEVLFYSQIAYNLMNYMEFINDEFVQVQLEHHFGGLLMSVIPLARKTKLRSLVTGKMMTGRISRVNNNQQYLFAEGSHAMSKPYFEVGFGIENILKIARIDFVWRLNYLDHENIYPIIVKPSFQFKF